MKRALILAVTSALALGCSSETPADSTSGTQTPTGSPNAESAREAERVMSLTVAPANAGILFGVWQVEDPEQSGTRQRIELRADAAVTAATCRVDGGTAMTLGARGAVTITTERIVIAQDLIAIGNDCHAYPFLKGEFATCAAEVEREKRVSCFAIEDGRLRIHNVRGFTETFFKVGD